MIVGFEFIKCSIDFFVGYLHLPVPDRVIMVRLLKALRNFTDKTIDRLNCQFNLWSPGGGFLFYWNSHIVNELSTLKCVLRSKTVLNLTKTIQIDIRQVLH
jgi:hypothetical protein